MGTRYRYHTPDGGPPNGGIPPGLEPPQGTMFAPQYPASPFDPFGPPQYPPPQQFGPPQFGPPQFPPPHFGQCSFGPFGPPQYPQSQFGPQPGPFSGQPPMVGSMMCFPTQPPPPYAQNPWARPVAGPSAPTLANERPPPGARVNGQIAKFGNRQGHIHSENNTSFHIVLDGGKPWIGAIGGHRFQLYTAASNLPLDQFIRGVGADMAAPVGTPRNQIGVQEAIEVGDGQFIAGSAFCLEDPRMYCAGPDGTQVYRTLEQLGWSSNRGEVGQGKPVTIALLP